MTITQTCIEPVALNSGLTILMAYPFDVVGIVSFRSISTTFFDGTGNKNEDK